MKIISQPYPTGENLDMHLSYHPLNFDYLYLSMSGDIRKENNAIKTTPLSPRKRGMAVNRYKCIVLLDISNCLPSNSANLVKLFPVHFPVLM